MLLLFNDRLAEDSGPAAQGTAVAPGAGFTGEPA